MFKLSISASNPVDVDVVQMKNRLLFVQIAPVDIKFNSPKRLDARYCVSAYRLNYLHVAIISISI
ncbi:MAG: hypothetical protein LBT09_02065 [Planctomycetaceae bacterium]|nr:hypothetical protein [Planctomycetaceae bacterium]